MTAVEPFPCKSSYKNLLCGPFVYKSKSKEPTSGLEPLTCSLRVRPHAFTAVSRCFKNCLHKPYLPVLRFWTFPAVRSGYCHSYCQPLSETRFVYGRAKYTPKWMTAPPTINRLPTLMR